MSGANLTYTVTVISNGPDPALSITMTDLLPAVISNTVTIRSGTYDPVSSNNSSTVTVTVSNAAPGGHPDHDQM